MAAPGRRPSRLPVPGIAIAGGHVVHKQAVVIPTGVAPGPPEAALFTDAFFVQETGNLEVTVQAPVSNSWLYLDGALINEETGAVDDFDLETSYYFGARQRRVLVRGLDRGPDLHRLGPPGRYMLAPGAAVGGGQARRPATTYACAAACPASTSSPGHPGALRLAARRGLAVDALRVAPLERERPRLGQQLRWRRRQRR